MSERFTNREIPSTFRRGPVSTINGAAVLNTAFDGEPHFTDEGQLYVYDEASDTMVPVSKVASTVCSSGEVVVSSGEIVWN
jgi:hypothetical protein